MTIGTLQFDEGNKCSPKTGQSLWALTKTGQSLWGLASSINFFRQYSSKKFGPRHQRLRHCVRITVSKWPCNGTSRIQPILLLDVFWNLNLSNKLILELSRIASTILSIYTKDKIKKSFNSVKFLFANISLFIADTLKTQNRDAPNIPPPVSFSQFPKDSSFCPFLLKLHRSEWDYKRYT